MPRAHFGEDKTTKKDSPWKGAKVKGRLDQLTVQDLLNICMSVQQKMRDSLPSGWTRWVYNGSDQPMTQQTYINDGWEPVIDINYEEVIDEQKELESQKALPSGKKTKGG